MALNLELGDRVERERLQHEGIHPALQRVDATYVIVRGTDADDKLSHRALQRHLLPPEQRDALYSVHDWHLMGLLGGEGEGEGEAVE